MANGVAEARGGTTSRARTAWVIAALVGIVAIDQLTKAWAASALADGPKHLIGDFLLFDLSRKYNDAGAQIETHIYAQGKHAFNMGQRSQYVSIKRWPARLAEWLEDRGYLRAAGQ